MSVAVQAHVYVCVCVQGGSHVAGRDCRSVVARLRQEHLPVQVSASAVAGPCLATSSSRSAAGCLLLWCAGVLACSGSVLLPREEKMTAAAAVGAVLGGNCQWKHPTA